MKRLLKMSVAGLNRTIFIALVIFWPRSYTFGDFLGWHRTPAALDIYSTGGLVCISAGTMVSEHYPPPQGWEGSFWPFRRNTDRFEVDLRRGTTLGFHYERWARHSLSLTADARIVTMPYWFLVLCTAIVPALFVRGRWRARRCRRRVASGLCAACGYYVRGSTGRCPKCGTSVSK